MFEAGSLSLARWSRSRSLVCLTVPFWVRSLVRAPILLSASLCARLCMHMQMLTNRRAYMHM